MNILKTILKATFGTVCFSFFLMIMTVMLERKLNPPGPMEIYLIDQFHSNKARSFITDAFEKIPLAQKGETALALGGEIADRDLLLPLEKGYGLIAVDYWLIGFEILLPSYEHEKYREKIKIIHKFEWGEIPPLNLVMSSFISCFFPKEEAKMCSKKLKSGGYFIGNFFGPDFNIQTKNMTFYTKEEVLELFKDYDILQFEEVKKPYKENMTEHYFEVFARKR
jgi:hypothetical protein